MTVRLPESELGQRLTTLQQTICTAESCTGGLILHRLTNIAGSSAYVLGGVVAYANSVKQHVLNVRQGTLIAYGAVSEPVATEMAQGVRLLLAADWALSVTGIAGPGGGTAEKPVGLVYIGLAGPADFLLVERYQWEGDRESIKQQSATAALTLALRHIR
jgi:PncC family amidohydrolase